MRCVPSNAEVVLNNQPQQELKVTIEDIIESKKVEVEEKREDVIEIKAVPIQTPKEEKPMVVESIKKVVETEPESESKVDENIRVPRRGFNLYTISAVVKIGQEKFHIQKVIEEKDKRLANIEYDRAVKKEFGKSKSMTKRTLKEYKNGDEDFCNKIVDEAPVNKEKTPEEIEFEKKLDYIESDYFGLYKVTFAKNNVFSNEVVYVFADNADDVPYQIRGTLDETTEPADFIISKIKNIVRMTRSNIRIDKGALKRLSLESVKDLEEISNRAKTLSEEHKQKAIDTFEILESNGFEVYGGKGAQGKKELIFAEMARSEDEAECLVMSETRMMESFFAIRKSNTKCGATVKKLADMPEDNDKKNFKEFTTQEKLTQIKILSKKEDSIFNLFFVKSGMSAQQIAEKYINFCDKVVEVKQKVFDGKGTELLEETLDKLSKEIKEQIEGSANLHRIAINKNKIASITLP